VKIINEMMWESEKNFILKNIQEDIDSFDKEVLKCINEKSILEYDLKLAEMKLITYY